MVRLLRSRLVLAGAFAAVGGAAALGATGNLPGLDREDHEPAARPRAEPVTPTRSGTAFRAPEAIREKEPRPVRARSRARYRYEDDYRRQLYERYFGYEEEEEDDDEQVEMVRPAPNGGGPGEAGDPGQPGIPSGTEGGEDGAGTGGAGGPGGPGGG